MIGRHHRLTASWNIWRCSSVPLTSSSARSSPWRRCSDSSAQIRRIARTYGAYDESSSAFCVTSAAPSMSHPITATSPHVSVG